MKPSLSFISTIIRPLDHFLRIRNIIVTQVLSHFKREIRYTRKAGSDIIRLITLELIVNEIRANNILGSVAELGVYRGDFAQYINDYFPDRYFYLFDTFKGFDHRDTIFELKKGLNPVDHDFSDTNIEIILKKMKYEQKCIIKKGFFPESLNGLEDNFCFVSLDADLYQPTLKGLEYFFPRLNPGGFILVHDYNNDEFSGVRAAVRDYSKINKIVRVPVADAAGTLIIGKS